MKKILFLFLSALMFMTSLPTVAQDARQRKPETIVQDVLALMPIQKADDLNREVAPLVEAAPQTVGILVGMLKPTAMKANNKVEYALNAITNYATANTKYKEPVLQAMKAALGKAPDDATRQFLESQIRLLGPVTEVEFTTQKGTAPYAQQFDALKAFKGTDFSKPLLKALKSKDRPYRVQALEYVAPLADEALYAAVAKKFKKLSPDAQTDVLYWIGDNHVASQADLVLAEVQKAGATAPAAMEAAVKLGGEKAADALLGALGTEQAGNALNALYTYKGKLNDKLSAAFSGASAQKQQQLLQLASRRGVHEVADKALELAASSDAALSAAAIQALPGIVSSKNVAQVAALLDKVPADKASALQTALNAAVATLDANGKYQAIAQQMKAAKNAERFFTPLAQTATNGSVEDLKKVVEGSASQAQKAEALKALKSTSNYAAASTLFAAGKTGDAEALNAYISLVKGNERGIDSRCRKLGEALQVAKTADVKKNAISALASAPTQLAFNTVAKYLDDKDVSYEAAQAVKQIAGKCVDDLDYKFMNTSLTKAMAIYKAHGTADDGYAVDEIKNMLTSAEPSPIYQLTPEEKKEGYEILFDGTNLDKWEGNTTDYTVQNGTIYISANYGGGGNLYTKKEYKDFIYRFEFCFVRPGVNNGIGIRTPEGVDAAYDGMCEIQVLDHDDPIYAGLREYQVHGSVYGVIPAKRIKHKPLGEWSTEEICVKGDHITVIVNGETIVDGDIRKACQGHNVAPDGGNENPYTVDHRNHPGMFNKKGHIGFLGHGAGVKFRNVRIRELK